MRLTAVLLVVFFLFTTATATTWYIQPDTFGDAPTIQAGIDSSTSGDTVLLANGTYTGNGNRDIDYRGKAITVRSENGDPALCVIDCQGSRLCTHRGFYFFRGEGSGSVLEGVAVVNGYKGIWESGGGILCVSGSSPSITNCNISGNSSGWGSGIGCQSAGTSPTIADCEISGNNSWNSGGGVSAAEHSHPTLINCIITGNSAERGAGLNIYESDITLTDCTISDNIAEDQGGGARFCDSDISAPVHSCIFSGNSASNSGGGVHCRINTSPTFTNCTFAENSAPVGAGIYVQVDCFPIVENTIVAFSVEGEGVACLSPSTVILSCSDVYGNEGGDWVGCISSQDSINGNFHADPLFCGGQSPDRPYSLAHSSPCASDTCGLIGALAVGCTPHVTWDGGGNGYSWNDPDNWSPDCVPGEIDQVLLPAIGDYTVEVSMNTTVWSLTIDSSLTYSPTLSIQSDTLTLTHGGINSGQILVREGAVFEIAGSSVFVNEYGGDFCLEGGHITGDGAFVNRGNLMKTDPDPTRAISSISVTFDNRHDDPGDGSITVNEGTLTFEEEVTNAGSLFVGQTAQVLLDPGDGSLRTDLFTNTGVVYVEGEMQLKTGTTVFSNLDDGLLLLDQGDITGDGFFRNYGLVRKIDPAGLRATSTIGCRFGNMYEDPGDGPLVERQGIVHVSEGVLSPDPRVREAKTAI